MASLRLAIVTPSRALVETDADSVVAPGSEGELGVLPGHAPLLVALRPGVVRYSAGSASGRVAISGGFAEVTQERVSVLAPLAERPEQIDPAEAEARRARAAAELAAAGYAAPAEELAKLREALEFAQARVDALRS
ncbi:MAG TPA: ATP synthase F1 subunit epsilon [Myxococcota bacterium]|nr:ATP synthase F1 subunit epsilon [Myxococcota bacterium]